MQLSQLSWGSRTSWDDGHVSHQQTTCASAASGSVDLGSDQHGDACTTWGNMQQLQAAWHIITESGSLYNEEPSNRMESAKGTCQEGAAVQHQQQSLQQNIAGPKQVTRSVTQLYETHATGVTKGG